jgi:hypothetical protein
MRSFRERMRDVGVFVLHGAGEPKHRVNPPPTALS